MKIKLLAIAAALAIAVAPASALTLEQAMNEVAGYNCSGSSCSSSTTVPVSVQNPDVVTVVDLPDIETSVQVEVTPAVSKDDSRDYSGLATWCPMVSTMNGGKTYPSNVNRDCVPYSINSTGSTRLATFRTETIITDGGTETVVTPGGISVVDTCVTTTKTLTYNGPFTDRSGAWSVSSESSSSGGAC